jgi:hypothetical protein
MGRTGTCADNAAMESFFALPQSNVLDRKRWSTRAELRLAIVIWIERTFTAVVGNAPSGKLTRSSSRQSSRPPMRPHVCEPRESTEPGVVPCTSPVS